MSALEKFNRSYELIEYFSFGKQHQSWPPTVKGRKRMPNGGTPVRQEYFSKLQQIDSRLEDLNTDIQQFLYKREDWKSLYEDHAP